MVTQPPESGSEPRETRFKLPFSILPSSVSPDTQELPQTPASPLLDLGGQRMIPVHSLAFRRDKVCFLFIEGIGLDLASNILLAVLPRKATGEIEEERCLHHLNACEHANAPQFFFPDGVVIEKHAPPDFLAADSLNAPVPLDIKISRAFLGPVLGRKRELYRKQIVVPGQRHFVDANTKVDGSLMYQEPSSPCCGRTT